MAVGSGKCTIPVRAKTLSLLLRLIAFDCRVRLGINHWKPVPAGFPTLPGEQISADGLAWWQRHWGCWGEGHQWRFALEFIAQQALPGRECHSG